MPLPSPDELLIAYDTQLRERANERLPEGVTVERDGPLVCYLGFPFGGFISYRDLGGLERSALDELIARQVAVFAERGERFEWKHHGHDLPTSLPERLRAYLETDASNDSRPILERLGFVPVATTTPYIWSPPTPS